VFSRVASGRVSDEEVSGVETPKGGRWLTWLTRTGLSDQTRAHRAELLRYMTRTVEAAKLPPHEQADAEAALLAERRGGSAIIYLLLPRCDRVTEAGRRGMASARALRALLGCERYRLKHGKWPAKLADLVPAYLPEVPTDPCNGEPMRYEPWADGVEVSSVGEAGAGGGNLFQRNDYGYRLWDKEKRRQPAPPKAGEGPP
jgi:hypothetical protein